jgi:hypothetical protein
MPHIVDFIRALVLGGFWSDRNTTDYAMAVLDMIEEPHKWSKEYAAWAALARPSSISFTYDHGRLDKVMLVSGRLVDAQDVINDSPELVMGAFDYAVFTRNVFR